MAGSEDWKVEFRGGPLNGLVSAVDQDSRASRVAKQIVANAVEGSVFEIGEVVGTDTSFRSYRYVVIAIDRPGRLITVELQQ